MVKDVHRDEEIVNANTYTPENPVITKVKAYVGDSESGMIGKVVSIKDKVRKTNSSGEVQWDINAGIKAAESMFKSPGALGDGSFKDIYANNRDLFGECGVAILPGTSTLTIMGSIDKVMQMSSDDMFTAQGLTSVLNNLSGDSELASFLGMEEAFEFVNGLCQLAIQLNIPEYLDLAVALLNTWENQQLLWVEQAINAARMADIDTWAKCIDKAGDSKCFERREELVKSVMQYYHYRPGENRPYGEIGWKVVNTIESFWPDWDWDTRRNIPLLDWFCYATRDMSICLGYTDRRVQALSGRRFMVESAEQAIGRAFPQLISW